MGNMMSEDRRRKRAEIYNSPLWRNSFRAESPNHGFVAEINPAWEVSMGGPTHGTLCLSAGLHLDHCSPVFLWSADSRFLVVPRFVHGFWRGLRQHLLVVDVAERWIYRSASMAPYLQPESFVNGRLTVIRNPHRRPTTLSWQIPGALSVQFTRKKGMWSYQVNGQPSDPCVQPTGSTDG
jgi:hypothetical protein